MDGQSGERRGISEGEYPKERYCSWSRNGARQGHPTRAPYVWNRPGYPSGRHCPAHSGGRPRNPSKHGECQCDNYGESLQIYTTPAGAPKTQHGHSGGRQHIYATQARDTTPAHTARGTAPTLLRRETHATPAGGIATATPLWQPGYHGYSGGRQHNHAR